MSELKNVGRDIDSLGWIIGEEANSYKIKDSERAYIVNEFHGEYDIDWVVIEENGQETMRYNTKYVDSIVWKSVNSPSTDAKK